MNAVRSDRDRLFGILAMQVAFLDRDRLVAAISSRPVARDLTLGDLLVDRGDLTEGRRALVESLVEEHVRQHGGDPSRGLATFSSLGSASEDLAQDPGLDATTSLGLGPAHDVTTTMGPRARVELSASPPHVSQPGRPRFEILRPHARGGLGAVSVALDTELNREVALKQILERHADDPNCRARFVLEAELTGSLEHPSIVPVYSLGSDERGRPYYAMRFIQGDSLKDAIARFHSSDSLRPPGPRALEFQKLLRHFLDACKAVAYAHSRGVVHRDLKPDNIMVGRYGETLVVDWGLGKVVDSPEDALEEAIRPSLSGDSSGTLPGSAVGTPAYMSPEQAAGRIDRVGPASDVYSLGATLYALLTGRPSVDGPDLASVLDRVRKGLMHPPRRFKPEVSPALEAICLRAMALRTENRYPSPAVLAADIEAWLADEPVSAWQEPLPARVRRWARSHPRLVSGAAATLFCGFLALVGLAVVVTGSNRRLDEANDRLAGANTRILAQNARITSQNQQLEQINRDLGLAQSRAERERDQAESVTDFLVSGFRSPDPARDGRRITIAEVLSRNVEALRDKDGLAPATRASILGAIGESYTGLGLVAESVEVLREARDLCVTAIGPEHPDTLAVQNNLADACRAAGRFDEAAALFEQTLRARRAVLGDDHPDTLSTQNDLAVAYRVSGRLDDAIPLLEATLRSKRAALGEDHPNLLVSQNNLASTYYNAGRLEDAISLQEATLEAARAAFGDRHPGTLASQNNLAAYYQDDGRLDEAIELLEAALGARRAELGDDHPSTLTSQNNLANAYLDAKRPEEAIGLLEQTLRARRAVLGDDHPDTLHSSYNLAAAFLRAGRLAESEPLLLDSHRALSERADSLPAGLRETRLRESLNLLIQLYDTWDKPDETRRWRRILEAEHADPVAKSLPVDVFARPDGEAPDDHNEVTRATPKVPAP